ncbi:MAG: TIM44-like domain-containing protein [Deltaproteobacteria bacterium]|nr:TIM44-like domain-containing protein [Deltaproteobacteria bacterium]
MKEFLEKVLNQFGARLKNASVSSTALGVGMLAMLLLLAFDALARAGGGGNYSGGGGGGSGGGGGGDGGGEIIIWLVYLAVRHPQVGVPLLVIGVAVVVLKHRFNPDNTTARAIRNLSGMAAPDSSGLARIQQRDASFQTEAFIDWVKKIDNDIQSAWSRGDMAPVRNFLSDGLFRRFATQLAIMKHQNVQNPVADHRIFKCAVHAVEQDAHFDTIHVAIEAEARDVEVPANLSYEEAMARAAKASSQRYTEIWSFLRRPGAKTLDDRGFNQGTCPNCGAPLENTQSAKCEYCNALVNSGDYDWVLAEITQTMEWRPSSTGQVPGLAAMQQLDAAFNRQVAEDRASYVFWRWIEATVTGKQAPLAKCATPHLQQQLLAQGPLTHFKTAVGSVDLVEVSGGTAEATEQRYVTKILWSSAATASSPPIHRRHLFVFSREGAPQKSGGLSHAHCPNCLGPLSENDSSRCEYCDAELTSGKADWVLSEVLLPYEYNARAATVAPSATSTGNGDESDGAIASFALPDMASRQERALLLMNMAAVVMADGVVTKQERKLLRTASKRWDVPMEMVNPILYGQVSPESIHEMKPENPKAFVDGLIGAALIDGKIDRKELTLLLDISRHLGLEEAGVRNRMNTLARMSKVSQVG